MKKFEYKTISLLLPVDDKEIERDVEDAKKRAEHAIRDGREVKIEPYFSSFKQYQERLNQEGNAGWQVVGMFPALPRSMFGGSYDMNVTFMRELPEQVEIGSGFKAKK